MASARTVSPTRAAQTVNSLRTVTSKLAATVDAEVGRTGGLLRLAPCWVPRSFLQPGLRLKLHPDDVYTYGASRGGIDERWFASTTEAANEGRGDDEGLSYVVVGRERFTLRQAVAECGAGLIGQAIWGRYGRWPVYSKFFDNLGPIPHHLHQSQAQARLVGREGKPEGYYFPPQHNSVGNNFPYTFFGLDALGDEIEEPFGIAPNDLPLASICRTIERDLLAALGETELPPPTEAKSHCLL